MNTEYINGEKYLRMLLCARHRLEESREKINSLNVFPVPDGDTGDNMLMTIFGGTDTDFDSLDLESVCGAVSKGMLYGARGNSGVILSRFFFGLNSVLAESGNLATVQKFTDGLKKGVSESYLAVGSPKEGTILTVMRESLEAVETHMPNSFDELFDVLVSKAEESLKKTPEKLNILKKAGVVDSGGAGLLCIFNGMREGLGEIENTVTLKKSGNIVNTIPDDAVRIGYCTEFILQLRNSAGFDIEAFKKFLFEIGESVVAFKFDDVLKVHVHTFSPDRVLSEALRSGELLTVKIENMTLQHTESTYNDEQSVYDIRKKVGIVAVASGDGIKKMLKEGGCDIVIDGGQSMNPSSGDILDGIRNASADIVFVFANNANILLSAKQAADMCDFCRAVVVPTEDIGQCYLALSELDIELNPDEQLNKFISAAEGTLTCFVSQATRHCVENGIKINAGEYIGFSEKKVFSCAESAEDAVSGLIASLDSFDIALVICGEKIINDESEKLIERLEKEYPNTEFMTINGGQPIYDYIIILS